MNREIFNLGMAWTAAGQAFARVAVLSAAGTSLVPGTVLLVPQSLVTDGEAPAAGDPALLPAVLPLAARVLSTRTPLTAELAVGARSVPVYVEPVLPGPSLVIMGAGHIAAALCPMALAAGYDVTVVDDRPAYAHPGRFPGARVLSLPWAEAPAALPAAGFTAVALVTRGYEQDIACLTALLQSPTGQALDYLGMIGSRRRVAAVRRAVEKAGVAPALLDRVHAPIGLDIGAETPGEIAVAIMAEVIWHRHGGGQPGPGGARSRHQGTGAGWPGPRAGLVAGEKAALVTVISTRGATPRAAGASMLVWEDGTIAGTVGGGGSEEEIRRAALEVMGGAVAKIVNVDYTADPGEAGARICGGVMTVLIEPVVS